VLATKTGYGQLQRAPLSHQPIQIDFNFNIDLEELGQLDDVG
jgi:hypothetical protein